MVPRGSDRNARPRGHPWSRQAGINQTLNHRSGAGRAATPARTQHGEVRPRSSAGTGGFVFTRILATLAALAALTLSASPARAAGAGYVRLAHLSPDTPAVDVYLKSDS